MTNVGDHDENHGRIDGRLALRKRRAPVAGLVGKHRREQVGRAVDDGRLPEEAVGRCDVPVDANDVAQPVEAAEVSANLREHVQRIASPAPPVKVRGFDADRIERRWANL